MPDVVGQVGASLAVIAVLGGFVLALASIVIRFRRSAGVERAQVKWLIAAVALTGLIFPLSYLTEAGAIVDVVSVLAGCLVPISIGVAVLRYRLYDIDRIVSRIALVGHRHRRSSCSPSSSWSSGSSRCSGAHPGETPRGRALHARDGGPVPAGPASGPAGRGPPVRPRRLRRRADGRRRSPQRLRDEVDLDTLADGAAGDRRTGRAADRAATIWLAERGSAVRRRWPWVVAAACLVVFVASNVIYPDADSDPVWTTMFGGIVAAFVIVGALLCVRVPDNPIGLVMLGSGVSLTTAVAVGMLAVVACRSTATYRPS